jgi:hypothetical protein
MREPDQQAHQTPPHTEPARNDDGRSIKARWNTGHLDSHGHQRQVLLLVEYDRTAYVATVGTARQHHGQSACIEPFQPHPRAVVLCTQPSNQFSCTTLTAVYEAALTDLRRRFDAKDAAILPHFESTDQLAAPLARAYLPQVTRRFVQIMNSEPRANAEQPGSVVYVKDPNPPGGATRTAWDLFTEEAVRRFRRAGAIIVDRTTM